MFDIVRIPGVSHEQSLYLAHDGYIDAAALRLARQLDAAEAADRAADPNNEAAVRSALTPRPRDPGVVLAHMAQALIDGVARDGACTAEDLRRYFTKAEIERHIEAARDIARGAIVRRRERFKPVATFSPALAVPDGLRIVIDVSSSSGRLLSSTRTTLGQFLADNADFDDAERAEIRGALALGRTYRGGGGAAPTFDVRRARRSRAAKGRA